MKILRIENCYQCCYFRRDENFLADPPTVKRKCIHSANITKLTNEGGIPPSSCPLQDEQHINTASVISALERIRSRFKRLEMRQVPLDWAMWQSAARAMAEDARLAIDALIQKKS